MPDYLPALQKAIDTYQPCLVVNQVTDIEDVAPCGALVAGPRGDPIALDESVRGPREALAAVEAEACDVFVVKLMKTGGILNALKVNAIAEAAGVSVMIGNMGESSLGLAAHFHVAAALANVAHCDADLPWRPGGLVRDIGSGLRAEVREAGLHGASARRAGDRCHDRS